MAGDGGGIGHAQAKRLLAFYDAAARGESGKEQRNAQRVLPYWRCWRSRLVAAHPGAARFRQASRARRDAELLPGMRHAFDLIQQEAHACQAARIRGRGLRRALLRLRLAVRWHQHAARAVHVLQRVRVRRAAHAWSREARRIFAATTLAAATAEAAAARHAHRTWRRATTRRGGDAALGATARRHALARRLGTWVRRAASRRAQQLLALSPVLLRRPWRERATLALHRWREGPNPSPSPGPSPSPTLALALTLSRWREGSAHV